MIPGLPVEFIDIMKEVDKLSYADDPNYNEIYGLMGNAIMMSGEKVRLAITKLASNRI